MRGVGPASYATGSQAICKSIKLWGGPAGYMVGCLLNYTVISWDWGYLSIPISYPHLNFSISIPIPSPSRLTMALLKINCQATETGTWDLGLLTFNHEQ